MLSKPKDYDVFVSYCEDTGESYAGAIKRAFAHRNFTTFVSGLDKLYIEGKWEEFIDNVIRKCKIFVLLLTIDALESEQVRRELDQLRLKGIDSKNFWIIRLDIPEVPRDSECVNKIVASKLSGTEI